MREIHCYFPNWFFKIFLMLPRQWSEQCRGLKVSKVHLFLFSRSVADDDLNSLLDWKWVKSTSLSRSKSISSSFRSIVDNDPNRLLHRKWAESSSLSFLENWSRMIWRLSLRKLSAIHFSVSKWVFSFSRSILDDDPKTLYRSNVSEIHFCCCLWIHLSFL